MLSFKKSSGAAAELTTKLSGEGWRRGPQVPPSESYDARSTSCLSWTERRLGPFVVLIAAVVGVRRAAG